MLGFSQVSLVRLIFLKSKRLQQGIIKSCTYASKNIRLVHFVESLMAASNVVSKRTSEQEETPLSDKHEITLAFAFKAPLKERLGSRWEK